MEVTVPDTSVHNLSLIPVKEYKDTLYKAVTRLPELDDKPNDLYEILFKKEELEWCQKKLKKRRT